MIHIHINSKLEVIIFMVQIHKFLGTSSLPKLNGRSQRIKLEGLHREKCIF